MTAFDGLDAEGGGQMGLARADGAEQNDVARGGDQAQRPSSSTRARSRPWARFQSNWARVFWAGSRAAWRRALDGALGPGGQLGVEQRAEVLQRRPRFGERLARSGVAVVADGGELQDAGLGAYGGEQDVDIGHAEALSRSAS